MNQQKLNLLKDLEAEVAEFILTNNNPIWQLPCNHQVLWTAPNIDSKIMVAQMAPNRSELYWALKDDVHDDYVMHNPGGYEFKETAHRAGFNVKQDFFYCNIIPFFHIADIRYTQDVINDLLWIYDKLRAIVQPEMIITLGQDALTATLKREINVLDFEDYILDGAIFKEGGVLICPLEDPDIVESENSMKHKAFFATTRRLYIKSHNIRNNNG